MDVAACPEKMARMGNKALMDRLARLVHPANQARPDLEDHGGSTGLLEGPLLALVALA